MPADNDDRMGEPMEKELVAIAQAWAVLPAEQREVIMALIAAFAAAADRAADGAGRRVSCAGAPCAARPAPRPR